MSAFTESQAFVQFVQDRVDRSPGDPEIMFFDEVIKAKINRSRFRLGKEETKFLDVRFMSSTFGLLMRDCELCCSTICFLHYHLLGSQLWCPGHGQGRSSIWRCPDFW